MSESKDKSAETKIASTNLAKVGESYLPMIAQQFENNSIRLSDYSKQCVLMAISAINALLTKEGVDWKDPQLDQGNLTTVMLNVATLQLNATAQPREVYFILRNSKDKAGQWKKQIEMGIEGDGNDALLRRFGVDVAEVFPCWLVREKDKFVYPRYKGVEISPPEWEPVPDGGPVVLVVYPIKRKSGAVEYLITSRDDALPNLLAHISNNMMNETFGIAKSRYDATVPQKAEIDKRKKALVAKAQGLRWGALDDPELEPYISPAWREPHSREQMIIRKMRNNIVKKQPKDFGSQFALETYARLDDDHREVREEIAERANMEPIELEGFDATPEETQEDAHGPRIDPQTGEIIDGAQASMPGF